MAANFGASNQVIGVRQTTDFLEKFTWAMASAILVLSLLATVAMDREKVAESNAASMTQDAEVLIEKVAGEGEAVPQLEVPTEQTPAQE